MHYKSAIDTLSKMQIDDVESYLRDQIYELSSEPLRNYVRAYFNLLAQKQNILNYKDLDTGKRVVHIDYVNQTLKLE